MEDLPTIQEFQLYQALVNKHLGICLPDQKRAMLGHRLLKRITELGLSSFSEYYQFINRPSNKYELREALERITTNETFFFRETAHFEYMKTNILPHVSASTEFKVWSAACSTGEEPYSIAMTLVDRCPAPWSLLATDVNTNVIAKAKRAIYLDERMTELPESYRRRFCRKGCDEYAGYLRVLPELRAQVRFKQFNLLDDMEPLGQFDLIFLRNVLIYFDEQGKREIIQRIAKQIKPGGHLFVGHSESFHGVCSDLESVQPAILKLKDGGYAAV